MLHTFEIAKKLGHRAVIIFGHADYYPRAGFRRAAEFGLITTPDGKTFDPFMAYPLYEGALDGIRGAYYIDPVYESLTQEEALEFDKKFPGKEPHVPVPIETLLERLTPEAADGIRNSDLKTFDAIRSRSEREISSLSGVDAKAVGIIRDMMAEYGYPWGTKR
jgi:hypothetical protein